MLNHAPILIVEDEPFIALALQMAIEDAGGDVVGPVGTVGDALTLLQTSSVAAAVLDVALGDRDVTPVTEALTARGVPMVFQSARSLPRNLRLRCPDAIFYKKPASLDALLQTVLEMTQRQAQ